MKSTAVRVVICCAPMRKLCLLLLCSATALASSDPKRLFIDLGTPEVENGTAMPHDVSLALTREFIKNCPAVAVTNQKKTADYVLRVGAGDSILFNKQGDVAYTSPARFRVKNLAKDVCSFLNRPAP